MDEELRQYLAAMEERLGGEINRMRTAITARLDRRLWSRVSSPAGEPDKELPVGEVDKELVERVARAIVRVFEHSWEGLTPVQQEMARTRARVAVHEIRSAR